MNDEDTEAIAAPEFESCLLNAFALTNSQSGDRASSYGPFWQDYRRVADVMRALTDDEPLDMTGELAILQMVVVKLCRLSYALMTGAAQADPSCVQDSITDACGYLDGLWATLNNPEPEPDEDDDETDDEEDGDE
jgi:hypothetical protein